MNAKERARLRWIRLFESTGDAGLVCRRCGISRPTLRKWVQRYRKRGLAGLSERSRRPHCSPGRKVNKRVEELILRMRTRRNLGARRIQNELKRSFDCSLSVAAFHKVLVRHKVKPIIRARRKETYKSYVKELPGEQIQMDTCKICSGVYQYTAVDDCTRYRVLAVYRRRTAANTLDFLDKIIEEMPFPIQRIQTDRGGEFFAEKVQRALIARSIKFRPIKPRSPHLNGKVERSQKTDIEEFYPTVDPRAADLGAKLQDWQHYYNWHRTHGSLQGKTPMDRYFELSSKTPFWDEVEQTYDRSKERIQHPVYVADLQLRKLKRSL